MQVSAGLVPLSLSLGCRQVFSLCPHAVVLCVSVSNLYS